SATFAPARLNVVPPQWARGGWRSRECMRRLGVSHNFLRQFGPSQIRKPKAEIRKKSGNANKPKWRDCSDFGFRPALRNFGLRISTFGFRLIHAPRLDAERRALQASRSPQELV